MTEPTSHQLSVRRALVLASYSDLKHAYFCTVCDAQEVADSCLELAGWTIWDLMDAHAALTAPVTRDA